ncbi:AbrB family transcriptional regulator [Halorubellus sp. JP-L1]|uniref:SpoVR family protein n=1 Tax=Halorubellus sp. JP-L1 TaxID=2715753 RepID=UPI00140A91F0|nr:SpoVR family protein [Halorubellus sp. JP-L1]NHN40994.1 AbrB family transcriptional regulator [Halorubellus sp. JP-L1]
MSDSDRFAKQRIADDLAEPVEEARNLAVKLGLDPYDVNYWVVDYDEMNELIAYGGFQHRYPHWRWGMQYDRQQKQGQYAGGKAFEIVNNDDPAHAFLQESNTIADQKAVITHVEAHSDFFANNEWFGLFGDDANAAAMLERHANAIADYMSDPEVERAAVERWIDNALVLEDNIDQHQPYAPVETDDDGDGEEVAVDEEVQDKLADLDLSDEVRDQVFDEEFLAADDDEPASFPETPEKDVLGFLRKHGKRFDEEAGRAMEMTEWQTDLLDMLRAEAYYFAPQKMTKVMNEGWAAYWESLMMTDEGFAAADEFLNYADHMARVLGSPGLNPYKLGMEIWEYVENRTNRREVLEHLLRVDGVTWQNLDEVVDFDDVLDVLEPPEALARITPESLSALADLPDEYVDRDALDAALAGDVDVEQYPWKVLTTAGLARRHFSLVERGSRTFLASATDSELEQIGRYLFDDARYGSVEEALADVDYGAGWKRMREIRQSHNDVTFLDEFLTQEFVDANDYFTYEFSHATGQNRVASVDAADVKKKLLLQFTNFGKPTVAVYDGNFDNRNELLLGHQYNGVMLDVKQAKQVLERVFELWGRPVNLLTIVKELSDHDREVARRRNKEPEPTEQGKRIRFDGEGFEEFDVPWEQVSHLAADDVDYDTKPDEWLA